MARPSDHITIHCAVCDRPVERIERYWDVKDDNWVYTVRCHGDSESTIISRYEVITGLTFEGGTAFSTKRLTHV